VETSVGKKRVPDLSNDAGSKEDWRLSSIAPAEKPLQIGEINCCQERRWKINRPRRELGGRGKRDVPFKKGRKGLRDNGVVLRRSDVRQNYSAWWTQLVSAGTRTSSGNTCGGNVWGGGEESLKGNGVIGGVGAKLRRRHSSKGKGRGTIVQQPSYRIDR